MNTLMYDHPLTSEHLRVVKEVIGYHVVGPIGKALACGDIGKENPLVHRATTEPARRRWCDDGVERYCTARRGPLQPTKVYGQARGFVIVISRPSYPRKADKGYVCVCSETTDALEVWLGLFVVSIHICL